MWQALGQPTPTVSRPALRSISDLSNRNLSPSQPAIALVPRGAFVLVPLAGHNQGGVGTRGSAPKLDDMGRRPNGMIPTLRL